MKIKITEFAERHFDKDFGSTKILDMSVQEFQHEIDELTAYIRNAFTGNTYIRNAFTGNTYTKNIITYDGYADFCKLVAIPNFTSAKLGSMPITLENYQYIRSGYSARRDSELPTFSRWLELPTEIPKSDWLVLVLYDKEQMTKESMPEESDRYDKYVKKMKKENIPHETYFSWLDSNSIDYVSYDADWGVVAILGQSSPVEEPMKPETMLRNALGVKEGGSGHELNREDYLKSVEFWEKNITVS